MPARLIRLLLIRHAQAGDAGVDRDRPLTGRGERQAADVGARLAGAGLVPDRVLVSSALRAVQTWERARAALGPAPDPVVDERIYDNSVETLLRLVGETPGDVQTLALVGHNPSVGQLTGLLDDGEGSPAARRDAAAGFPAGALAVFEVPLPFAELRPGAARLVDFVPAGS